jgi:prevent-host-death family protein
MTIIGLKELRQNASQIAERAQKGERFIVVKRSKPMFTISPPQEKNIELDAWLDTYIDENRDLLISLKDK